MALNYKVLKLSIVLLFIISIATAETSNALVNLHWTANSDIVNLNLTLYPPTLNNSADDSNFSLILLKHTQNNETVYDPDTFLRYNPDNSFEVNTACAPYQIGDGKDLLTVLKEGNSSELLSQIPIGRGSNSNVTCYRYDFQLYAPALMLDNRDSRWYPFDTYILAIGFSYPGGTSSQWHIEVPEQFVINDVLIRNITNTNGLDMRCSLGTIKCIRNENSVYFNKYSPAYENLVTEIIYTRNLSSGNIAIFAFAIFGISFALALAYIFGLREKMLEGIVSTVIIAGVGLYLSLLPFVQAKPSEFTLFDISIYTSIILLVFIVGKFIIVQLILDNRDKIKNTLMELFPDVVIFIAIILIAICRFLFNALIFSQFTSGINFLDWIKNNLIQLFLVLTVVEAMIIAFFLISIPIGERYLSPLFGYRKSSPTTYDYNCLVRLMIISFYLTVFLVYLNGY